MYKKVSGLVVSLTTIFVYAAWAEVPAGYPTDYQKAVDAAVKEGKVVIYFTTDTKAAGPLIKGFEVQYPGVRTKYNDMNSAELYNRYISEQVARGGNGDVVQSSSMDTALKLATEYAEQYASPEVKRLPDWAVWRQKAYGTTYEPVVFIYNKGPTPQNEVPNSYTALAKLIASQAGKFKDKVATYDIEKSGLGFMLVVQDSQADANYSTDLANIAKGGLTVQSSTGTMMGRVSSDENLIGYNILGPYAKARARNDPSLGIAYPKDYVLVLSHISFISQENKHPNTTKLWPDYVLSERGQQILASQADISSICRDIEDKNDIDGMTALLGKTLKPISVNETLLDYLQPQKRPQFTKQWRNAVAK